MAINAKDLGPLPTEHPRRPIVERQRRLLGDWVVNCIQGEDKLTFAEMISLLTAEANTLINGCVRDERGIR